MMMALMITFYVLKVIDVLILIFESVSVLSCLLRVSAARQTPAIQPSHSVSHFR